MVSAVHPLPLNRPDDDAGVTHAQRRFRRILERWLIRTPVVWVTYLAKLTVPPFGGMGLTLAVPIIFAAAMLGLVTNRLLIDLRRFSAFVMMEAVLWGTQVFSGMPYSPLSLLLLTVLHIPYVFYMRPNARDYKKTVAFFLNTSTVIAVCGIAQYLLQYVIGPTLVFPIENYFPPQLIVSAFNQQGWIEYGSAIYRANGIFMLEPSFFSQLLGIAIIVELTSFQRVWRVVLLGASLLMAASGTGLLVLATALPVMVLKQRRWDLILLAGLVGALVAVVGATADVPFLNVLVKRSTEFSATGSSGFIRYISGFYMFEQFLWPDPIRTLFGFGSGQFTPYSAHAVYSAAATTLFKMVFEFGIVGATCYFIFLFYCVGSSSAPIAVRVAIAITLMLSGIHIPFAHGLALTLLLWGYPPRSFDGATAPREITA